MQVILMHKVEPFDVLLDASKCGHLLVHPLISHFLRKVLHRYRVVRYHHLLRVRRYPFSCNLVYAIQSERSHPNPVLHQDIVYGGFLLCLLRFLLYDAVGILLLLVRLAILVKRRHPAVLIFEIPTNAVYKFGRGMLGNVLLYHILSAPGYAWRVYLLFPVLFIVLLEDIRIAFHFLSIRISLPDNLYECFLL